jgi:hypothetical protein
MKRLSQETIAVMHSELIAQSGGLESTITESELVDWIISHS